MECLLLINSMFLSIYNLDGRRSREIGQWDAIDVIVWGTHGPGWSRNEGISGYLFRRFHENFGATYSDQ